VVVYAQRAEHFELGPELLRRVDIGAGLGDLVVALVPAVHRPGRLGVGLNEVAAVDQAEAPL